MHWYQHFHGLELIFCCLVDKARLGGRKVLSLRQGSPTHGLWFTTGLWLIWNRDMWEVSWRARAHMRLNSHACSSTHVSGGPIPFPPSQAGCTKPQRLWIAALRDLERRIYIPSPSMPVLILFVSLLIYGDTIEPFPTFKNIQIISAQNYMKNKPKNCLSNTKVWFFVLESKIILKDT